MLKYLVVLTASLALVTCAPPPQIDSVYTPKCWDQRPVLRAAVFAQCRHIIHDIPVADDPDVPLKFSDDPAQRPDIKLPAVWGSDNEYCHVGVHFRSGSTGYDRTTLHDIQGAAMAIALECVIKPPHLGGLVRLGWEELLVVTILRSASPDLLANDGNGTLLIE
ncbi:MAG: hypothetical protein LQ338_005925 [Usnochroma carphineum]|nr:MAG: hypothetical protein LQ338_005925 [Usnochroma carphineum]